MMQNSAMMLKQENQYLHSRNTQVTQVGFRDRAPQPLLAPCEQKPELLWCAETPFHALPKNWSRLQPRQSQTILTTYDPGKTPTTKQTRLRVSKSWATRSMLVRLGTACAAVRRVRFARKHPHRNTDSSLNWPRSPCPWHRSSMHPALCSCHKRCSTQWDFGGVRVCQHVMT